LIRASALKTNCPLRDWFTYKGFEPREGEGKRARMETGNIFEPLVLNRFLKENPHIIMERPPENARRLMIAEVNGLLVSGTYDAKFYDTKSLSRIVVDVKVLADSSAKKLTKDPESFYGGVYAYQLSAYIKATNFDEGWLLVYNKSSDALEVVAFNKEYLLRKWEEVYEYMLFLTRLFHLSPGEVAVLLEPRMPSKPPCYGCGYAYLCPVSRYRRDVDFPKGSLDAAVETAKKLGVYRKILSELQSEVRALEEELNSADLSPQLREYLLKKYSQGSCTALSEKA
jgi:CRISPR/Cas system-associated exonuclease Cas4 (RecB family)